MARTGDNVRFGADFLAYWAQINLTLAIAIERFILIAKATDAANLLNKTRRKKIYAFAIIWVSIPPIVYFYLHFQFGDQKVNVSTKIKLL